MNITQTKILFAVLNWGLGHASRSIPLIYKLIKQGKEIHLAAAGEALLMLKKEFPELPSIQIPDYKICYPYKSIVINALIQFNSVKGVIKDENRIVVDYVKLNKLEMIISDSAFGAFYDAVPSVLISHQLNLPLPKKIRFLSTLVQYFYHGFLKPFSEIWVPDFEGNDNLSGALSHGIILKSTTIKFIGIQSRFADFPAKTNLSPSFDIVFILSGPEPSRTVFEKLILNLLDKYKGKVAIVRGKFSDDTLIENENIMVFNYLDANQLYNLINNSKLIVCRSGYSSLMDLVALNRKAILIPTPGQTEQEYLAQYQNDKGKFNAVLQNNLNLDKLIGDYNYESYLG